MSPALPADDKVLDEAARRIGDEVAARCLWKANTDNYERVRQAAVAGARAAFAQVPPQPEGEFVGHEPYSITEASHPHLAAFIEAQCRNEGCLITRNDGHCPDHNLLSVTAEVKALADALEPCFAITDAGALRRIEWGDPAAHLQMWQLLADIMLTAMLHGDLDSPGWLARGLLNTYHKLPGRKPATPKPESDAIDQIGAEGRS